MEKRVKKIFNNLKNKPDLILIRNSSEPFIDDNFFYFTGLDKGLFEGSIAILYPDGDIDIIVSELEEELAKKTDANILVYKSEKEFANILKNCISSFKKIGLNSKRISLNYFYRLKDKFTNVEFLDISDSFEKIRLIKDELEIKTIKFACKIADKVMEKIPQILKKGMYEYELAAEINYLIQKNGADKAAFDTISSFGKNTSQPHYSHGNIKLNNGDFVLCDFGACFKKYNSDLTRTFIFGKANEKQKLMYKIVLEAHRIGLDTVKSGLKANVVHEAVNSYIDKTEFRGRFIHSTGHPLGLAVHDGNTRLGANFETELKENMVFTIEPGIYLPGFGGVRIEDDILIKRDRVELLTKTTRELIEI